MTIHKLILGVAEAAERIDVTRKTIYELQKTDKSFPRIFKVTRGKSGILASELEAWVAARHAGYQLHPDHAGQERGAA